MGRIEQRPELGQTVAFDCQDGRSYMVKPSILQQKVRVAGGGDRNWLEDLAVIASRGGSDIFHGYYFAALPFDHAYADLAAIATELPEAILISTWDVSDNPLTGLTRWSTSEPWGGANQPLTGRRGEGLVIGVTSPTVWSPRRLCGTGLGMLPGREQLLATKSGDDIALTWTADAFALGGYNAYRLTDKGLLLTTPVQPVHATVPGASPAFPVLDTGAVIDPNPLFYYQVAGKAADGAIGGF